MGYRMSNEEQPQATNSSPVGEKKRKLPRPNLWILLTVGALIALVIIGCETGYLSSWWNGTLEITYPDFPFKQLNKCVKLLQLIFALLAVFELVAFPTFFKDAKDTFVWVKGMYGLTQGVSSRALRLTRKTIEDYLNEPTDKKDVTQIVTHHLMSEVHREMDAADRSRVAKVLYWFSKLRVFPGMIKALTFAGFVVFTIADIFTS